MKFRQLIEYNKRKIFLQKLCRRWDREASSRLLFILKKCLIWGKSKWSAAYFQYISIALSLGYNKNKLYKTLDYWSRDMLNFNFPEKGSWASFSTTFCVWFFKNNVSCYILLTDQSSMSDYFYFSRYCEVCVLQWVLLNRPPSSTRLHPPPPSSIHLHPAHSSLHPAPPSSIRLHPALFNTLNNIWTKILLIIGQFPQICAKKRKVVHFDWKLAHMVYWRCWFQIQT